MYRVVLIDDEPWVLSGLEELIDWNKSGFTIVAKFTDPEVALEQIIRIRPDVIFTDIRMPKMSGVQLTASLKENNIDSEIVLSVLTVILKPHVRPSNMARVSIFLNHLIRMK